MVRAVAAVSIWLNAMMPPNADVGSVAKALRYACRGVAAVATPRDPLAFYDLAPVPGLRIETIARSSGGRANRIRFLLSALKRELPALTSELGLKRLSANKKEVCAFGSLV